MGSANPWSITRRFVPGPRRDLGGMQLAPCTIESINSLGSRREYSIGRVRSHEECCKHSAAQLAKIKAAASVKNAAYDFGYPDPATEDISDLTGDSNGPDSSPFTLDDFLALMEASGMQDSRDHHRDS